MQRVTDWAAARPNRFPFARRDRRVAEGWLLARARASKVFVTVPERRAPLDQSRARLSQVGLHRTYQR
jgi:hypothetical protein